MWIYTNQQQRPHNFTLIGGLITHARITGKAWPIVTCIFSNLCKSVAAPTQLHFDWWLYHACKEYRKGLSYIFLNWCQLIAAPTQLHFDRWPYPCMLEGGGGGHDQLSFALFFLKWISAHIPIPLLGQESVHSGSASWDDCGQEFLGKSCVSLFPWWVLTLCLDSTVALYDFSGSWVYMCFTTTCHLHFWQNDWGLLYCTGVEWRLK